MACLWIPVGLIYGVSIMDTYMIHKGIHTGNKPSTYRGSIQEMLVLEHNVSSGDAELMFQIGNLVFAQKLSF
jgi:hypothetical protein